MLIIIRKPDQSIRLVNVRSDDVACVTCDRANGRYAQLSIQIKDQWLHLSLAAEQAVTLKLGVASYATIIYLGIGLGYQHRFGIEAPQDILISRFEIDLDPAESPRPGSSRTPKCARDDARGVGESGRGDSGNLNAVQDQQGIQRQGLHKEAAL